MPRALLAIALAIVSPGLEALRAAAETPEPFRFAAIPVVSYGSDTGVSAASAILLYRDGGVPGRLERLSLGVAFASHGPRVVKAQWAAPRLLGTGWALQLDGVVTDDDRAPYWGEGDALGRSTVAPGYGTPPPAFSYHDRRVFAGALLRPSIARRPSPFFRVRWLSVDVLQPSALLAEARPLGVDGGAQLLGEAGVLLDTRDAEVATRRGALASASAFASPALGGVSSSGFGGVNVTASAFVPAGRRVTLAFRALGEVKRGDVPFYERDLYEGISYAGGLGGAGTLRGLARSRLSGEDKALLTGEIRSSLWQWRLRGGSPLDVGLATGGDLGMAHQRGYPPLAAAGAFAGLRAVWDRAVVTRLEVGYAGQGGAAIYLVTGEQF
jgi:hypothetical protein